MNPLDAIPELKKVAGFFEVRHKTSFQCVRKNKQGDYEEVTVEIFDAGPEADANRYSYVALSESGKIATGNPAESIEAVLSIVHWQNLDK